MSQRSLFNSEPGNKTFTVLYRDGRTALIEGRNMVLACNHAKLDYDTLSNKVSQIVEGENKKYEYDGKQRTWIPIEMDPVEKFLSAEN